MMFKVHVKDSVFEVAADSGPEAFWKLARFFGKLADGHSGDIVDIAGLNLSGQDISIESV